MKTIKIINLAVKISKNEKMPKKIRFNNHIYEYEKKCNDYYSNDKKAYLFEETIAYYYNTKTFLNAEAEIIEEQPADVGKEFKKIEKISLLTEPIGRGYIEPPSCCDLMLESKLNEVIDVLNEMRENK